MMPSNPNAPEVLREEILAAARREAEDIRQLARQESEAMLSQVQAEAARNRAARLAAAQSEAKLRREMLLAAIPVEVERLRAQAVERLLDSIRAEAQRRLLAREGFNYSAALVGLVVDAVAHMTGAAFVLKLAPSDCASFGTVLAKQLAQQPATSSAAFTVTENSFVACGVIIEGDSGRQIWDNRLPARLDRLWPALRHQLAVQTGLVKAGGSEGGGP